MLAVCGPELGLPEETALRIAAPFGGGVGRTGGTCGAISGALMAIGLGAGNVRAEDKAAKEECYRLARALIESFRARNASTLCRELLGCDIGTPEGFALAKERGLFTTLCPKLVRDAVEILGSLGIAVDY